MRSHRPSAILLYWFAALGAAEAFADGARDWENVPVDTNILFLYYTYSNTEASVEPSLPVEGVSVNAHVPILRYARTFAAGDRVAGFQLIIPYGFVDARLDGTRFRTSTDGIGDISAVFLVNVFGAPALTKREFRNWTPGQFLTASVSITAPTGSYDQDALLNVGKNRWAYKPQLSYGAPFGDGGLLSINANVQLFTDNSDGRNGRLEQKPLLGLEGHLSHDLNDRAWASLDAFYAYGGETRVAGADKHNRQNTLRLGISGSYSFTTTTAVSAAATRTVVRESYTPVGTTFSININHAF
ncbi:transporter [Pseudomonas sp. Marseille-QA0892]